MKPKTFKAEIRLLKTDVEKILADLFGVQEKDVAVTIGPGLCSVVATIRKEITVTEKEPTITFNPTTRDSDVIRVPAPAGTPQNPYVPSPYYVDTSKEPLDFHSTTGADPRSSTVVTAKSTSDDFAGENFTWGD